MRCNLPLPRGSWSWFTERGQAGGKGDVGNHLTYSVLNEHTGKWGSECFDVFTLRAELTPHIRYMLAFGSFVDKIINTLLLLLLVVLFILFGKLFVYGYLTKILRTNNDFLLKR